MEEVRVECEGGNWRNTKILVGGEDLISILSIRRVEASVEVNGFPQLTLFVNPWKSIVVEGKMGVVARLDDATPEWMLRALEEEIEWVRKDALAERRLIERYRKEKRR